MAGILTESQTGVKKYSKLLNNLLNIKGRDQTIFTRVNNTDSFDVTTKFSQSISKKLLTQKQFTINLVETDLDKLITKVSESEDGVEIINLFEVYKQKLFNSKKALLLKEESFEETKEELLTNLEDAKQKTKIRWKQYRRKVLDSNIQENIWPLHIGSFFISVATPQKNLYGPLLLKEVELNILPNDTFQLKSEADWKPNEKLLFMLEEAGFPLDKTIFNREDDFTTLAKKIYQQYNLEEVVDFSEQFQNYKIEEIINQTLKVRPGVVLGIFKPSGGNLRKTMQKIIENEEVDEILDIDPDKRVYKKKVDDFILNSSQSLVRIQKSNFSQDKALISALNQDTIIWGPPGTGKSQVIANIIANILYFNKTAIVMSQKKAALDVLKKRLGSISPFALFILNDNKMDKAEFYKPLQEFVQLVENNFYLEPKTSQEIISDEELKMLEIINKTRRENTYLSTIEFLQKFEGNDPTSLKDIFNLNPNYIYPTNVFVEKEYYQKFMELNNIPYQKRFLVFKTIPNSVKALSTPGLRLNSKTEINPNEYLEFLDKTNLNDVKSILEIKNFNQENHKYKSDEKFLQNYLASRILNKISGWKQDHRKHYEPGSSYFEDYKKFANAVRAGRRLPYKFMNDHISIIKELFPIIITTPETDFINWEKNFFDYVVLDESSQIFLEVGLPILYLAKIKVLAGDQQQMQPSRWFTVRTGIDQDEEEDVVENADSLLDYALDKGVYQIMLNQNYRSSAASLMSFSSNKFYNSELKVLDNKAKACQQPIEVMNVDGKWNSGTNEVEAKKVIHIAKKELDNYKTIIILTFNANQRQLIEKEILQSEPKLSKAIEAEHLVIRNIENIQGDEADLVIMSVVYDATTSMAATYVARAGGKNALNVAISRAKDKIIVVKSIDAKTIKNAKSEDFLVFKEWLRFLDLNKKEQKSYAALPTYEIKESFGEVDSNFERDAINFIINNIKSTKKLSLVKQFDVGSYLIDLALLDEDNTFVLGIEVDGYKYHNGQGFDKYLEDLSRQEFLESKGYNIYRITEIDFKLNQKKIINDLTSLLD